MSFFVKDTSGRDQEFNLRGKYVVLPGGVEISSDDFEHILTWFRHGGIFGQLDRPVLTSVMFAANGGVVACAGEEQCPAEQLPSWERTLLDMIRRGVLMEDTEVRLPQSEPTTVGELIASGRLHLTPQEKEYFLTRSEVLKDWRNPGAYWD